MTEASDYDRYEHTVTADSDPDEPDDLGYPAPNEADPADVADQHREAPVDDGEDGEDEDW